MLDMKRQREKKWNEHHLSGHPIAFKQFHNFMFFNSNSFRWTAKLWLWQFQFIELTETTHTWQKHIYSLWEKIVYEPFCYCWWNKIDMKIACLFFRCYFNRWMSKTNKHLFHHVNTSKKKLFQKKVVLVNCFSVFFLFWSRHFS